MKKVLLTSLLAACLASPLQADLFVFSFDSLPVGTDATGIELYMEGIYRSNITVSGIANISDGAAVWMLGPDTWVKADGGGGDNHGWSDGIRFTFEVPITAVSFDWAKDENEFFAESERGEFFSVLGMSRSCGTMSTHIFSSPVHTLYFHDSGKGWIGIDTLTVTAVPIPAAVVLGLLGMAVAGAKLRRYA